MVRARMARVAVAAALGLAAGCSSMSSCSDGSWTSRLTSLFRRNSAPVEIVGAPTDGPSLGDPGAYDGPGCQPVPQSEPPPLIPAPRPYYPSEAHRMPYQP